MRLAAERGRLMEEAPEGAMLAVVLGAEEVGRELADYNPAGHPAESHGTVGDLWIAAENGPKLTVVSGSLEAVAVFAAKMAARRGGFDAGAE